MDWLEALILGIVQGLSEYLPISSSGHLEICKSILGLDLEGGESLQFSVMLHVATVLSTIVVLWREFMPLCVSFFTFRRDDHFYYVCKILVSCIPVMIVGLFFKSAIEEIFASGLTIVGVCLLITAALLSFTFFFRTEPRTRLVSEGVPVPPGREITWLDAFIIGCAQAVAVLPGLSRSGSTIATGLLLGDRKDKIAQFSFFMVIIPILGEALLDIKDMIGNNSLTEAQAQSVGAVPMIVGFLSSFLVGCLACKWMINMVKKGKLIWFAVYCAVVGILCLCWH